jgi:hypothetical protein
MANYFHKIDPYELSMSGLMYSMSSSFTLTGNQTVYVQIKTGDRTAFIADYRVSSSAEPLKLTAIESPTVTNGSIALTAVCLNRQKDTIPVTTFFSNPTSVVGGTVINVEVVTAGGKGGGAQTGDSHGWTLKKNADYLWKIEQLSNQATVVTAEIIFAELYGTQR